MMLIIDLKGELHVPSLQLLAQAALTESQVTRMSLTPRLQKDTQFVKNVIARGLSG